MVVFEHRHRGERVPVRIDAADKHAVLFHEAEARGRLARAG